MVGVIVGVGEGVIQVGVVEGVINIGVGLVVTMGVSVVLVNVSCVGVGGKEVVGMGTLD